MEHHYSIACVQNAVTRGKHFIHALNPGYYVCKLANATKKWKAVLSLFEPVRSKCQSVFFFIISVNAGNLFNIEIPFLYCSVVVADCLLCYERMSALSGWMLLYVTLWIQTSMADKHLQGKVNTVVHREEIWMFSLFEWQCVTCYCKRKIHLLSVM